MTIACLNRDWMEDPRFRGWKLVGGWTPSYEFKFPVIRGLTIGKPQDDVYYILTNDERFMYVRTVEGIAIEYYPSATDDDLKEFNCKNICPEWSYPYLSKRISDDVTTHLYQTLDVPGRTIIGRWDNTKKMTRHYEFASEGNYCGLKYQFERLGCNYMILYLNGPYEISEFRRERIVTSVIAGWRGEEPYKNPFERWTELTD